MLFEKPQPENLLVCPSCKGTGLRGFGKCNLCRGASFGVWKRGRWLEWAYPLSRYHLALLHGRRILNKIRRITLLVLWLNCWIWMFFLVYKSGSLANFISYPESFLINFSNLDSTPKFLFWLGVAFLLFLWYRLIVEKKKVGLVEKHEYGRQPEAGELRPINDWQEIKKIPKKSHLKINTAFTDEAMSALAEAYSFADQRQYSNVEPTHLFYSILSFNRIANVFIRLGIPAKYLRDNLAPLFNAPSPLHNKNTAPMISVDLRQIIFNAYDEAYQAHQNYVGLPELLLACVKMSPSLQEFLYDLNIGKNKLQNAIEWARTRERLYRQYVSRSQAASHRSKYGMDKAMTAIATPLLNAYSEDMTRLSQLGYYDFCVAREKETEEIFRVVEGGAASVLLAGPHGVGKMSIVEGLADRMAADDVPQRLADKRLVKLNIAALLSGTSPAGAIERMIMVINEITRAGNIILFIPNIHDLVGVSAGDSGSLDMAEALADYLKNDKFLTVASTTEEDYARHIAESSLANAFVKIKVEEMNEDQAIQVLESKIGSLEHKNKVFFSYDAVEKSVELGARFLHETYLPGSALEIASEAAAYTRQSKGNNTLVTAEEVAKVVAEKTGVPVTTVSAVESDKLLTLEVEMHKKIIGQDEAVDLVANALRRARVEIRAKNRPISSFLFLGPTGVGKTELAKTIAIIYFGGQEKMIRLDMSEYQDKSGLHRLIGAPGEQGTGILTEAIRKQPFTLLLLDEIEKADKDILNLFLQVMDDGRLTDSVGRTVDFSNTIIIATSNAGTAYVQQSYRQGLSGEAIKERLLHGELKDYFRPEFLNRFDGIVLFKSLTKSDVKKIAGLMINRIVKDLEEKGIELIVEEAALDFLAQVGFDPEFGARPMRRVLQERVENKLAELLLSGKIKRRDKVILRDEGELIVV